MGNAPSKVRTGSLETCILKGLACVAFWSSLFFMAQGSYDHYLVWIKIASEPVNAGISINNQGKGSTPYLGYFHAGKEYTINFVPPEGYDFLPQTLTVDEAQKHTTQTYWLSTKDVPMDVVVSPSWAQVSITGGPVRGEKPRKVTPGMTYIVTAKAAGYHTQAKSVTVAPCRPCEVSLELVAIALGQLHDPYLPCNWLMSLAAPLGDKDVTCVWTLGGKPKTYGPRFERSFRLEDVISLSLTVTANDGPEDKKTTSCDIHVCDGLRIEDKDDAFPPWLDLESVSMSFMPSYIGAEFRGYEIQATFYLHGQLPERPDGNVAFFRVELVSERGGQTVTETATMLWRPEEPGNIQEECSSWSTAWMVKGDVGWASDSPVASSNPPQVSAVKMSMLCSDLNPARIILWRASTGVDPTFLTTVDETSEVEWLANH